MTIFPNPKNHPADEATPKRGMSIKGRAAAVTLSLAGLGLVAVPVASAAIPSGGSSAHGPSKSANHVDQAKQRCESAVTKRQDKITKDLARVQQASTAPASDRTELTSQLQAVAADLTKAKTAIDAASTPAELREACKTMVSSTRVYVLYGTKTNALVATDRLAKIDARTAANKGRLDKIIARAEKRGVSPEATADAKAKVADASGRLADAQGQIKGQLPKLMPITVAQVNDGSAKATLSEARNHLKAAASDAKAIRADIKAVRNDLRTR